MSFINFNNFNGIEPGLVKKSELVDALLKLETKNQTRVEEMTQLMGEEVSLNEALSLFTNKLQALSFLRIVESDKKPGPDPYMTGLDDETEEEKEEQMKKQAEMDDDNPDAYKEMPGDEEAREEGKVKTSKHTKSYHELYGDGEKNESTKISWDSLLEKIKEASILEGKGYDEARKVIDHLRAKVFKKLNDDELEEFKKEIAFAFGMKIDEDLKEYRPASQATRDSWLRTEKPERFLILDPDGNALSTSLGKLKTDASIRALHTRLRRDKDGWFINDYKNTPLAIYDTKNKEVVEVMYRDDSKYWQFAFNIASLGDNKQYEYMFDIEPKSMSESLDEASINKIQKEWSKVTADMKATVDAWKEAEGTDKESLLAKLKDLTSKKKKLEADLEDAVGLQDMDAELAEDEQIDEQIKLFMRDILNKMVPAAFGSSFNIKMRDELKDAVKQAIEPILKKYDYTVESESLNEAKLGREDMMSWLEKTLDFVRKSEDFNGSEGGIWVSGENGEEWKGKTIYSYYAQGSTYELGMLKSWEKELNKRGWYSEWHDAGTVTIWPL